MTELGITPERVVYEDKSRNTFENAVYAMDVVKPRKEELAFGHLRLSHAPRLAVFSRRGMDDISGDHRLPLSRKP